MQEARSTKQSVNVSKLYYVSKDYIVQDAMSGTVLIHRNGGGTKDEVDRILKMCNMRIIKKINDKQYLLEAN
jgi:hypothetical protein